MDGNEKDTIEKPINETPKSQNTQPSEQNKILQFVSPFIVPLIYIFTVSVFIFVLYQSGIFCNELLEQISQPKTARGLITFLFAVGTIIISLMVCVGALFGRENDAKDRFYRAKEILTILVGILGTIVGFYFGSATNEGIEDLINKEEPEIIDETQKIPEDVNIDSIDNTGNVFFELIDSIGPYDSGSDMVDEKFFKELIEKIQNRVNDKHSLCFMIIAGKVDKRPLKKTLKQKYGSNIALAQVRAARVREYVINENIPGLDPKKLIAIATGPELVNKKCDNKNLETDRKVLCYALWFNNISRKSI